MPFHRFIDPNYFEAVPLPGTINLNDYDRVNVTSGGVGLGGSSPADSAKIGGPTPGTYFVAFGEDGTSLDANRGFRALAENADLLDDLLHRDLAVPKISAQFTNVAGTTSFTIVENGVFVGSVGTPANDATRGGIIGLVDASGGLSDGQPLHVITVGGYQAVKVTAIVGFGTGFGNSPLITVSPTIPAGVAFKVVYYTRQSPASQPEDLVVDVRTFDGAWEADIWAFARNILEINQTFLGDITFAGLVTFSGPVSFPFGLQAPVVINGLDPFDALTINAVGSGAGLVLTSTSGAGTLDVNALLLSIPDDTLSSASGAYPSILSFGRSNTGAGDAAIGVYGIGGIASGGGLSAPGVIGLSLGGDSTGVLGISNALNGIGVEGRAALYGVKGELLASGAGNAGVYGYTAQILGSGVQGDSAGVAPGVRGDSAGGAGGEFYGLKDGGYFEGSGPTSYGVEAVGVLAGVFGDAFNVGSGGIGVYGRGRINGPGVFGLTSAGIPAVWGENTLSAFGVGVFGRSALGIGIDGVGGNNKPGVRGSGGAGSNGHGVVGTGGSGSTAAGVFGTGAVGGNGSGLAGQGSGAGHGVFAIGGSTNGTGGFFTGGGIAGAGVIGIGSLGAVAGGASGGIFQGVGAAPGIAVNGGGGFLGFFSDGGVFQGGVSADGLSSYAGAPGIRGRSGIVGYGKSAVGARGLYGVLGTVSAGTASLAIDPSTAGVRGAAEELGVASNQTTGVRNMYGGMFTGTGLQDNAFKGGYGLFVAGSASKANIRMIPRIATVPNTGLVGDVYFDPAYGLVVCVQLDVFTGKALWRGIPLTDPVWVGLPSSPYRDPEAGIGPADPEP